ncbi:MAG: HDIG domain-containing protein [Bacteroidales bacterium]|nr:HDIG domain-containing protein [Bacteroidales bacterium]
MEREQALELLLQYNKEEYHIRHALTVEEIMRWYANELGHDSDFWSVVGLLHDLDFELYPDQHCIKAAEILEAAQCDPAVIHGVCSHAYNVTVDVKPEHEMEKVLYAVDELSGIIWAATKMRPSGSVMDMEVKSVKKKFKDKRFAAGCSRDIIQDGSEMLQWDLDRLFSMTLEAMKASEEKVNRQMGELAGRIG